MSLRFRADTIQNRIFKITSNQFKKPPTFDPKIRPTTTQVPTVRIKVTVRGAGELTFRSIKSM